MLGGMTKVSDEEHSQQNETADSDVGAKRQQKQIMAPDDRRKDEGSITDDHHEIASLIDEGPTLTDRNSREGEAAPTKNPHPYHLQHQQHHERSAGEECLHSSQQFELADIVEIEMQSRSRSHSPNSNDIHNMGGMMLSTPSTQAGLDIISGRKDSFPHSTISHTAKIAQEAKNDRMVQKILSSGLSNKGKGDNGKSEDKGGEGKEMERKWKSPGGPNPNLSLDDDVANVDSLLIRLSYWVILAWMCLVAVCYWIVPEENIEWYEGAERNAALVELSILSTAVIMKHFPLLWEINSLDLLAPSPLECNKTQKPSSSSVGRTQISGLLAGGLVTQFIAISTCAIMVCFPVPVMLDPILGSRVHFMRWCEWVPLAGYMTLMTECIDAPEYDGTKLTHPWKIKVTVAALESISTFCGLLFPFCTNIWVWSATMLFSFVTYSAIIFRYFEKKNKFRTCVWRGGGSVDEIELFERARMSLALHGMCCVVWTLITFNYFVTSAGHLFVSSECRYWTFLHDPAATMMGECFMDLLAKCLYMALIVEAHNAAFDEAKRANRRLAELRNTMSVVWENSSDTIAISVQKISGNITSMVSPSFFRSALLARAHDTTENIEDISAIILEHGSNAINLKKDSITKMSKIRDEELPDVGIKIIRKADFASVDLHTAGNNDAFEYLGKKNDVMTSLVVAFTDMLARAWQSSKSDELVFEHDTVLEDGSVRTKFEVKVTRLEENAVVVVVRNVSERYRRFEAEKRFVFETTARQKDAEANRFTRHEVKNGLLAAIEICGNMREQLSDDFCGLQKDFGCNKLQEATAAITAAAASEESAMSGRMENMAELDRTLHEVLDIVLAETMARDVIHEMYVPRMERIDINHILTKTRGFKATESQFSLVCNPSPLPILMSDQGLFKCIHGNAIRNAIKYGQHGGKITTDATYNAEKGEFNMKVINLPGPGHDKLVAMGTRASELVFSHGTRLHRDADLGKRSHSAGDGAWIIQKCANILGGSVEIKFEKNRTIFDFRAPVKVLNTPSGDIDTFHLPQGVWGIAIDDSKIQRKLLRRFFHHAGVAEPRQIILGQKSEEIAGFVDFVVDFAFRHPEDRIFLIADENLEMNDADAVFGSNHETISGSECIKQIRNKLAPAQELRMLALVRSANDSPQDLALYKSRAHGYMPKVPLRGLSVRETVSPLWKARFPKGNYGSNGSSNMSRIASIENLRDLTLISPVELLAELEQIDLLCVRNRDVNSQERWPMLWDKLHQLKGDLKSVNVDSKFSTTINLIEALRGENHPVDFMTTWLRIRSDVVSFISPR